MPPDRDIESRLSGGLRRTWELLSDGPAPDVPDTDAAWTELKRRLGQRTVELRPSRPAHSRRVRYRIPVAAAAVLVLAAVGLWLATRPVVLSVPFGKQETLRLPEGSTVHLNSGSEIRYPRGFRKWLLREDPRRVVALYGEAFFEVVPGVQPFIVATAGAEVEVLGTKFNVRAWDSVTEVAVASGRVLVRSGSAEAVLTDGDAATARVDSVLARRRSELDRILAWRRGAFAAVDRSLSDILSEIERRYDVVVDVEGGVALRDSMTLLYGSDTAPQSILHDICLVQGCRYRPTSRGFALFAAR